LVDNRWIRIATMDPTSGAVHVHRNGAFEDFDAPIERLPVVLSSVEWYRGKIEHLPMACIRAEAGGR
jgi:hypothetical protein